MTSSSAPEVSLAYGARPVSVDLARGRRLARTDLGQEAGGPRVSRTLPLNHQVVADRLSLAHWPPGHQIVVCGLAGGTGRTTITGLLATVLAELPFAHVWHPVGLAEAAPRALGVTPRRWDVTEPDDKGSETCTRSGAWLVDAALTTQARRDFSAVVIDAPAGMPSDLPWVQDDPGASIVLLTRPDRASLAETAQALVWMNDHHRIARRRVVTVINRGIGEHDPGSRAAAAALGIRCAAVRSLPYNAALAPGRVLPSGRDLPARVRRHLAHVALDVWSTTCHPQRSTR